MGDVSGEQAFARLSRARLRRLRQLLTAKGRRQQRRFLLDGEKLVHDAIDAEAPLEEILSTIPERWSDTGLPVTRLTRADSERLSETKTPQGHFAVVRDELTKLLMPTCDSWRIVALDAVQDAGNVGGIIRSAAAFGATAVITGPGTADPTHPRVVRAATGAWFQVPISRSVDLRKELSQLKEHGASVLATGSDATSLDQLELPDRLVWLFGNEGSGVSSQLEPMIDQCVSIPIARSVDSLNVNVAAGIILHQARARARERSLK